MINKGIKNIGNTCYVNSIIQCITHLYEFNKPISTSSDIYNSWITLHTDIITTPSVLDISAFMKLLIEHIYLFHQQIKK